MARRALGLPDGPLRERKPAGRELPRREVRDSDDVVLSEQVPAKTKDAQPLQAGCVFDRAVMEVEPVHIDDALSSPTRTRTWDMVINSHPLYQLSYRGMEGGV